MGKGAIAGSTELIAPNLNSIGLWPFGGSLRSLDVREEVIVAETYPGEVYAQLGISRRLMGSKRLQEGRRRVAAPMLGWLEANATPDATVTEIVADGFSPLASGEDAFDAFVGMLGMIEVVDGRRAEGVPAVPGVATWEGWILWAGTQRPDWRPPVDGPRSGWSIAHASSSVRRPPWPRESSPPASFPASSRRAT